MANRALEEINANVTRLQDQLRQADAVLAAAVAAHAEKTGDIKAKLADWAEFLDVYHGAVGVRQPRAKKTTPPK